MGGGGSKEPGEEEHSPRALLGVWTALREAWWTSTASTYKIISSVGDALTSCCSMSDSSWSV